MVVVVFLLFLLQSSFLSSSHFFFLSKSPIFFVFIFLLYPFIISFFMCLHLLCLHLFPPYCLLFLIYFTSSLCDSFSSAFSFIPNIVLSFLCTPPSPFLFFVCLVMHFLLFTHACYFSSFASFLLYIPLIFPHFFHSFFILPFVLSVASVSFSYHHKSFSSCRRPLSIPSTFLIFNFFLFCRTPFPLLDPSFMTSSLDFLHFSSSLSFTLYLLTH